MSLVNFSPFIPYCVNFFYTSRPELCFTLSTLMVLTRFYESRDAIFSQRAFLKSWVDSREWIDSWISLTRMSARGLSLVPQVEHTGSPS